MIQSAATNTCDSHLATCSLSDRTLPSPVVDSGTAPAIATALAIVADTERLGDEIARLAAHLHAATYRLLVLIREFDEREGWSDGFRTCGHWLSWRTGIAPGAAREKVRVARALGSLPLMSAAMKRGALSFSKIRAMTRVASPDNEAELVELAAHTTAAHMERIVKAWRRIDRLDDAEAEAERHESRYLRIYQDDDGMFIVSGRLDPEVGAVLEKALEWAEDQLYRQASAEERVEITVGQRRADAVGLLAEQALAGSAVSEDGIVAANPVVTADRATTADGPTTVDRATIADRTSTTDRATTADGPATPTRLTTTRRPLRRADRFQVVLHVGGDARHEGGLDVSAETSRRLACDAGLVVMTHDDRGRVLDVGRKRRTVPAGLRRALEARDGGCAFPGCGVRHTDVHHIKHWAEGGHTRLDNAVLACRHHHRAVHEGGWTVRLGADGRPVFYRPDGRRLPEVPPSPAVPHQPATALEQANHRLGVDPDAWTATPDWHGESLDLGLAIDMLRK